MRVLADANIFIAYLLKPRPDSFVTVLLEAVADGEVTLLMPAALLEEIERTILKKPRLHQVITAARLQRFLALLAVLCEEIPVIEAAIPPITRDPKDDYLIAYAVVGRADYLVSGDNDLLVLQQAGQVQIVTSAQFRQILRKGS